MSIMLQQMVSLKVSLRRQSWHTLLTIRLVVPRKTRTIRVKVELSNKRRWSHHKSLFQPEVNHFQPSMPLVTSIHPSMSNTFQTHHSRESSIQIKDKVLHCSRRNRRKVKFCFNHMGSDYFKAMLYLLRLHF